MPIRWKTIRITFEAWKRAKQAILGEDVDLDDFLSYIIEMCKIDGFLSDYLAFLDEEEPEEETEEEDDDVS